MNNTKYETRPIETWAKSKELRRKHFWHTWQAQEKGEVVVMGMTEAFTGFLCGLGDYADPSYGPHYTRLMRDPAQLLKVMEAVEAEGHSRDLCCTMRCYIGQLYTGLSTRSPKGDTIKPSFIFQVTNCHTMPQTAQLFAERLGIPHISIDMPFQDSPHARQFIFNQLQETIEKLEKLTGRKWNDERMVEGARNEMQVMKLWALVIDENKNIPAPYDLRHLWSLRMPLLSMRQDRDCVEYLKMLYDETKWRVANQISARGYEKSRILHEGFPPYFHISILKYPADFGAIFVMCENTMGHGLYKYHPDGSRSVGLTWEEQMGRPIRTREDALLAQIDCYMRRGFTTWFYPRKREENIWRARYFHADAAVISNDRGCHGYQTSMMEVKTALQSIGLPVGTYDDSQCDPRDFSLPQSEDRLEALMERLGLTRLESATAGEAGEKDEGV